MSKKNQSVRLTEQHKDSHGTIGIFGDEAQKHDHLVGDISKRAKVELEKVYPQFAKTSIQILASELFNQLTKTK